MINRRTFTATAVAVGAIALLGLSRKKVQAQADITARNIVLVHGAYADGSCWSEVIRRLQKAGLKPTAVQNPLT